MSEIYSRAQMASIQSAASGLADLEERKSGLLKKFTRAVKKRQYHKLKADHTPVGRLADFRKHRGEEDKFRSKSANHMIRYMSKMDAKSKTAAGERKAIKANTKGERKAERKFYKEYGK